MQFTNTILQMEHSTSAPNERVRRIMQRSKLSVNHTSVVLTADVFQYFYKINKPLESAPRGSPSEPNFWWCNNGDILVCHTRWDSSSPQRRNEPLGHYFTIILDRMFGLIGAYYHHAEADFSFLLMHLQKLIIVHIEIWVQVFIAVSYTHLTLPTTPYV